MKLISILLVSLLFARTSYFYSNKKPVWIAPNALQLFAGEKFQDVLDHPREWEQVRSRIGVFQFYVGSIALYAPEKLVIAIETLKESDVKIAVEAGGMGDQFCPSGNEGRKSAALTLTKLEPIYEAGGKVSFLTLDSPLSRVLVGTKPFGKANRCQWTLEKGAEELLEYVKAIHAARPEIQLGLIVNFPNDAYRGTPCYWGQDPPDCYGRGHAGMDYAIILDEIMKTIRAGGETLGYLHVDSPYFYSLNHTGVKDVLRERILPLRDQAKSLGLRFGLIFNNDQTVDTTSPSDQMDEIYAETTETYIKQYLEVAGELPRDPIIQSWFPYPHAVLPETATSPPTFMSMTLKLLPLLAR